MPSLRKKSFAAEQLARQKKTNPVVWVLVGVIVVVLAVGGYVLYQRSVAQKQVEPEEEQIKSIAVLPFVDMSQEKDQEWFCDGIAETILNNLTQIDDLKVIARTSAFSFKGKNVTIDEIAHILNVEAILEGSVIKSGNRLQITAQLIKADQGYHLWSETYKFEAEDVFPIIEEISLKIVEALKITINAYEKAAVEKRYTENTVAFNLYSLGRFHWGKRSQEGFIKALEYFRQAIEIDAHFALAHAGIADVYNTQGLFSHLPPQDAFPQAKESAEKALAIDETLAEAHASLGWAYLNYYWDWEAARESFLRALELNQGYAMAHHWYADYLSTTGQFDEAIAERKRALELDPMSLMIMFALSNSYRGQGRYDEGLEMCDKAIEIDPNFQHIYMSKGMIYLEQNRLPEAFETFQKFKELAGDHPYVELSFCWYYALSDNRDQAERILASLIEKKHKGRMISSLLIAMANLTLGDNDTAMKWLDRAYEEHDPLLSQFILGNSFDPIRDDPRFKALIKKLGLPE